MTRKLLVCRLGAGSITIALCAALPGCNLAILPDSGCIGRPSSRGMSAVECPDGEADTDASQDGAQEAKGDSARDPGGGGDAARDEGAGDRP